MELKLITKDNFEDLVPYSGDFVDILDDYFKEVHGDLYIGSKHTISIMITTMLFRENKSIYLLIDKEKPVGFLIVFVHEQYGITPPNLYVDYMYVTPNYRSGNAIMMLYSMVGNISEDLGMDVLGTTFVTSSNKRNNKLVGGEILAEVTYFNREKFNRTLNKFNKRINK